jgi:hypothetical protein
MPEPDMSGVVTTLLAFFGGLLAWFVLAMVVVHHATGRSRASGAPRARSRALPLPGPTRAYAHSSAPGAPRRRRR